MHTLTAIIRAQKGSEALVHAELLKVGLYVKEYEPKTIGYFVAQDLEDPCVFSTYERFTDKAAMEQHNDGAGAQGFFAAANNFLDGEVIVVTAKEVWPKGQ